MSILFVPLMRHIHFHILIDNFIERILRHSFYLLQGIVQILCQAESKVALTDGFGSYLSGKVVKATKEIGMNLLQTFYP